MNLPGQVISPEILTFMRKLDEKEIHGYHAAAGLKLLKLGKKPGANGKPPQAT